MKKDYIIDMPFEEYLEVKACHKSALGNVKTAKHLRQFENKSMDTDALRFGRIFHTLLLEPSRCPEVEIYSDQEWLPKADHPEKKSINEQKAEWKSSRDMYYANEKEKNLIDGMITAINQNPLASKYLKKQGDPEASLFWKDEKSGLDCKTRLDFCIPDEDIIVEIKTDTDPEPVAFGKKIYQYDYQVGAWFNAMGYEAIFGRPVKAFIFIAVEKSEPFGVGVYLMNAHDFDSGEIKGVPKMIRYNLIKRGGLKDYNHNEDGNYEIIPVQTPQWEHKIVDDAMSEIDAPDEESQL